MRHTKTLSILMSAMLAAGVNAQTELPEVPEWDIYPDTWVATDGAGRTMSTNADVGDYKYGKQHTVGIFYVTWHTANLYNMHNPYGADVSKVLEKDPNARKEASNAAWQPQYYGSYHWGEPEMGYFLSADPYVIRHDVSMLADAGVDVLILDVTNAVRYWDEWNALFAVLEDMKSEGNKVPKICFWSFNGDAIYVVQEIYDLFYAKEKYKDLWFYWYGKPLLLYNATPSYDANGSGHKLTNYLYDANAVTNKKNPHYGDPLYTSQYLTDYPDYIKNFFTLRNMWWGYYWWNGKRFLGQEGNWSFGLELGDGNVRNMTPLQRTSKWKGQPEEISVTPAQHPVSMVGKSWTLKNGEPQLDEYDLPVPQYVESVGKTVDDPESYGIYFQERWDEALSANPQFIYLNDWNEYTAGKYNGDGYYFMRRSDNGFRFIDQYNAEFNRTIGPVKGRYTDNYYMQMANNIRRYKGARPIPVNYGLSPAAVATGDSAAWSTVKTEYRDTKGDIVHRNFRGYGGATYSDMLGRNDIIRTKVALTADSIYFRVETADRLTSVTGKNWMLLFIDADKDHSTGWNGYDFVVNKTVYSTTSTSLMSFNAADSTWTETTKPRINVDGNILLVALSRADLGLTANDLTFDFKWVDNARDFLTPIGLATAGDAAPNRRFNYRFIWHRDGSAVLTAKDNLLETVEQCLKEKIADNYIWGKEPGMIADSAVVARYSAAFDAAYTALGDSLSEEEYSSLLASLKSAVAALKSASVNPLTDGYYYIRSANSALPAGKAALAQTNVRSSLLRWEQFDADNSGYVWKVTAREDGGYNIQNRLSGMYINRGSRAISSMLIRLSDTLGVKQFIRQLNGAGQCTISNEFYDVSYYEKNGEASAGLSSGTIISTAGGTFSPAAWKLENADGYFLRNIKTPMDSLLAIATKKIASSTQKQGDVTDPRSPGLNSTIRPYLERVETLKKRYSPLDMYSIYPTDIDSLSKALDSLLAVWPDSTHLDAALAKVGSFITAIGEGSDVGQPAEDVYTALKDSYTAAFAMRPFYGQSHNALESAATRLDSLYTVNFASIKYPEAGVWYNIISGDTTATSTTRPGGNCLLPYSHAATSAVVWQGTPKEDNNAVRSSWRFVALSDNTYALQNVGSGWYLGSATRAGAQMKMSATPVPYKLKYLGSREWSLTNADNGLTVLAPNGRHAVLLQKAEGVTDSLTSWIIKRVDADHFTDSLTAVKGEINAICLPYPQRELPRTIGDEGIELYTITGSRLDASGKTIALELSKYTGTTVEAGYPLIYIAGSGYDANTEIAYRVFPEINGDITTESTHANGLVGVAGNTVIKDDTCGYFRGDAVVPATTNYTVKARSGYINAAHIRAAVGVNTDLTVTIGGDGLLNNIGRIYRPTDLVDVYSTDGIRLRTGVEYKSALSGLTRGVYVIDHQKYVVK